MSTETDIAYIAGLFDGEGSVDYTQRWEKRTKGRRYRVWRIIMDIAMTDELVIRWVHEILGVGSVMEKPPRKPHYKKQWRWRCSFREALYVAKLLWPHAQTRLHKIEQIIDHYDTQDESKQSADIIYLKDKRK